MLEEIYSARFSAGTRDQSCLHVSTRPLLRAYPPKIDVAYLVEVDHWLPEVVALLVEVSHSDLSEVTWMVFVHVRSVVVLSTSKTTTTWVLAVLSYTTVTGGNVSAAANSMLVNVAFQVIVSNSVSTMIFEIPALASVQLFLFDDRILLCLEI